MKFTVILLAIVALALAGCGKVNQASVQKAKSNQDTTQAVAFADKVGAKCVPNVIALRNHAGRVKAEGCVKSSVPPAKRQAFGACVTKVAFAGVPTKARLKAGLNTCYLQAVKG